MGFLVADKNFLAALAICGLLALKSVAGSTQSQVGAPSDSAKRARAKATFESVCASCHGLDGRGGERGPDLVSRPEVTRKADRELRKILHDGVTAAGMPAFASYASDQLGALVAYLREMQGQGKVALLPGDPARGRAVFFGKGTCAECHMATGQGSFWAQDLSAFAARMTVDQVRAAIIRPNPDLDPRRGLITVTLNDSRALTGVARNEDNFSLQLQTADGAFHLLNRAEIRSVSYAGRSSMPSDYEKVLSSKELDDLVSFLLKTAQKAAAHDAKPGGDDDDE